MFIEGTEPSENKPTELEKSGKELATATEGLDEEMKRRGDSRVNPFILSQARLIFMHPGRSEQEVAADYGLVRKIADEYGWPDAKIEKPEENGNNPG